MRYLFCEIGSRFMLMVIVKLAQDFFSFFISDQHKPICCNFLWKNAATRCKQRKRNAPCHVNKVRFCTATNQVIARLTLINQLASHSVLSISLFSVLKFVCPSVFAKRKARLVVVSARPCLLCSY